MDEPTKGELKLFSLILAQNKVQEIALKRIARDAGAVKHVLEEPNPAIVDTIWVTEIGTAVDYLDNIIQEANQALGVSKDEKQEQQQARLQLSQ